MVLVYEDVRHVIDKLTFHQRVVVGREKDATATVWVAPALTPEPAYKSTLPERYRPADLSRSLLAVWRNREVNEWYWRTQGGPPPGPMVPTPDPDLEDARRARYHAALHAPPPPPPPPPPGDDGNPIGLALDGALKRAKAKEAATTNGKPDVTEK